MSIPRRSYTLAVTRPGNLTSLPAAKIAVFQACELDLTLRLPTGETFDGATQVRLEIHTSQTSDPDDVLTTFVVDSPTGNTLTLGLTGDYLNHTFTGPLGEFWLNIVAHWSDTDRIEPLRCANLFLHRHNASLTTPPPPAGLIPYVRFDIAQTGLTTPQKTQACTNIGAATTTALTTGLSGKADLGNDGKVPSSQLPAATGGAWGSITGTLSAQTDLQAALDAKASVTSLQGHATNATNPHQTTAVQVGLGPTDIGELAGLGIDSINPQANGAAALDVAGHGVSGTTGGAAYALRAVILNGGSNNSNVAAYFSAEGGSQNFALWTESGAHRFGGNLDMTGHRINNAGNLYIADANGGNGTLRLGDNTSGFSAGRGGSIVFTGDDRAQGADPAAFAGICGCKENSSYLNQLGALVFRVNQTAGSDGRQTDQAALAEVARISSSGQFIVSGGIKSNGPVIYPDYTVGTTPDEATNVRGLIWVNDDAGGPTLAFSDGTTWRRIKDDAPVVEDS